MKDILKSAKYVLLYILFLLIACENKLENGLNKKKDLFEISKESFDGEENFLKFQSLMNDTINNWIKNELYLFSDDNSVNYFLDSLIFINHSHTKVVSILYRSFNYKNHHDGFSEFFGVKIKGKWYFWTGAYTVVPREMVKKKNTEKPLTYKQLHAFAIGSLSVYLDKQGNINDKMIERRLSDYREGWLKYEERYKYKSFLDGNIIDNKQDFWNYIWKKKGLGYWRVKFSNDSILKKEAQLGRRLDTDEKNEIRMFISSKMVLEK